MRTRSRLLLMTIAGMVLSCRNADRVTAPIALAHMGRVGGSTADVVGSGTCASTCALFNTTAPLWSAIANPDSITIRVSIADIRYAPAAGDSVSLHLTGDSALISGLSPDEVVDVTDGTVHASSSLRALTAASVVWRFSSADTTILHFTLNRALVAGVSGNLALTSVNSAGIVSAIRPWIAPDDGSAGVQASVLQFPFTTILNDVAPGCGAGGVPIFQNGTFCGVNVRLIQAVPADAFRAAGAKFQSDPGHGVSHGITILFDHPVASVSVTAYDPTFDGNRMSARDSHGVLIETVAFPGNHLPGTLTTQTASVSGIISSVTLTPAPLDYVAYSMVVTFATSPPPTRTITLTPATAGLLAPNVSAIQSGICHVDARRSARAYQVLVQDVAGNTTTPVVNQAVTLSLSEMALTGGHNHDAGRPVGSFVFGNEVVTITATTDASGQAQFTYFPPEAGGTYVILATTQGASNATDSLTVGLSLQALAQTTNEVLIGATSIHPINHFVTPTMAQGLSDLADSLFLITGHTLQVNDESLALGGVFDLNGDWSNPHCSHRDGRSADLRTHSVPRADSLIIVTMWQRAFGARSVVSEGTPPHTHVKTPH